MITIPQELAGRVILQESGEYAQLSCAIILCFDPGRVVPAKNC